MIHLVGDNKEFEVLAYFEVLHSFWWRIFSELLMPIIVCPWLPLATLLLGMVIGNLMFEAYFEVSFAFYVNNLISEL